MTWGGVIFASTENIIIVNQKSGVPPAGMVDLVSKESWSCRAINKAGGVVRLAECLNKPELVVDVYNPSTWEVEGGKSEVQSHHDCVSNLGPEQRVFILEHNSNRKKRLLKHSLKEG